MSADGAHRSRIGGTGIQGPKSVGTGLLALLVACGTALSAVPPQEDANPEGGFRSIERETLAADVQVLASPEFEGRDSPSVGLERAAQRIEQRLKRLGLEPLGANGGYRQPFTRTYAVPVQEACQVEYRRSADDPVDLLEYGEEFVPLAGCEGEAQGELVFVGFGITSSKERYDDLRGVSVRGKVVLAYEGEPRNRKVLEGEALTPIADLYRKARLLDEAGAVGVIFIRRPPEEATKVKGEGSLEPPALGFRYTWARWNDGRGMPAQPREQAIPVVEVSEAAASELLGEDVAKLARKIDRAGKPVHAELEGSTVFLATRFERDEVSMANLVAKLPGSDPALREEYVVLGAHYDHIGVDPWGRIGYGADDNASGSAALLELAEAMTIAKPRRSVLFLWFAAEEDGLIGSRRFCDDPPVPRSSLVAMFNMDMLGRGEEDEVFVLGLQENPGFKETLKRARKLFPSKVRKVELDKGRDLWRRSDHYSFHKIGVPVLFFFENYPESKNPDYHTYRDTFESLNLEKVWRSTRFLFNVAWITANDDERPAPPR